MKPDPNEVPHPPLATVEESCERDNACLEIELDGRAGLGRVVDARLFQPARREYARRLLEALCEHPGVRKAEVDLASSTCRVEFDLASNTRAVMGGILVEALRAASARSGKTPWWRRSPRWSTLTAYRSFGDLSLWETYADEPGSVRLLHRGHARDRAAASRLADSLAGLEGVERCYVSLWSHRITIDCGPGAGPLASRTVDRVERILEGRRAADPREAALRSGAVPEATDAPVIAASVWKRLRYKAMAGGAFTLTATIVVVTVVLAPLTPLALSVILLISSLSVLGVARMPGLAEDAQASSRAGIRTMLPLPAR